MGSRSTLRATWDPRQHTFKLGVHIVGIEGKNAMVIRAVIDIDTNRSGSSGSGKLQAPRAGKHANSKHGHRC
jgi:hypothetical protein